MATLQVDFDKNSWKFHSPYRPLFQGVIMSIN